MNNGLARRIDYENIDMDQVFLMERLAEKDARVADISRRASDKMRSLSYIHKTQSPEVYEHERERRIKRKRIPIYSSKNSDSTVGDVEFIIKDDVEFNQGFRSDGVYHASAQVNMQVVSCNTSSIDSKVLERRKNSMSISREVQQMFGELSEQGISALECPRRSSSMRIPEGYFDGFDCATAYEQNN